MNISKTIHKGIIAFLVFYLSATIYGAIDFPTDMVYLIGVAIGVSSAILFHESVLKFLTVKRAFPTVLLTVSILVYFVVYGFEAVIPGFLVNDVSITSANYDFITIEDYTLTKYATIALVSVTTGLIYSIMEALRKSKVD